MLAPAGERLGGAHRKQVHRDPWPDFDSFDPAPWPEKQRRAAALQWAGRARNEHGSVQQFAQLTQVLSSACVELELLGVLARMITDEVRHAELCARMAMTLWPEGVEKEPRVFRWPQPRPPWPDPISPRERAGESGRLGWAASAILTACCLGESLSKPMLDALVVVSTEPVAEAVSRQILRDEHLHAAFGFEALGLFWGRLDEATRASLQVQLGEDLRSFERSVCGSLRVGDLAGQEIVIERGEPNLGVLDERQYAMIFYACLEGDVFPRLREVGLDPMGAWAAGG